MTVFLNSHILKRKSSHKKKKTLKLYKIVIKRKIPVIINKKVVNKEKLHIILYKNNYYTTFLNSPSL